MMVELALCIVDHLNHTGEVTGMIAGLDRGIKVSLGGAYEGGAGGERRCGGAQQGSVRGPVYA